MFWQTLGWLGGWLGFAAVSVWALLEHAVKVGFLVWLWRRWYDEEEQPTEVCDDEAAEQQVVQDR